MRTKYINEFVELMRKNDRKWASYHIENGVLYFKTKKGVEISAETPRELEGKLNGIQG